VNVAIITARAGSKSIINKNIMDIIGKPLIYYPIKASQDAVLIDKIYVSTDGVEISNVSRKLGVEIIDRPAELGGDSINHGDVIKHAVEYVDRLVPNLENIVILLGNTVMVDGEIIDECLEQLNIDKKLDSVMTVWEAGDDHPNRAMEINNGLLRPYGNIVRNVSTERQSYKKAYYYDQGVWAFKKECVQTKTGPSPWWWMGKKSKPIIRDWVTGRDINGYSDVPISEFWASSMINCKNPKNIDKT